MDKQTRKYIYFNNLDFGGTVFQTQVLDWLYLYKKHNIDFEIVQAFHIKCLKRPRLLKKQIKGLRKHTELFAGSIYLFPSKNLLFLVNSIIIFLKLLKYFFRYHEILIFSRALIGREIAFLRKISPIKIIFYYDARAASAEENRYIAIKQQNFTHKKFITIANIYYLEYQTILAADKIFAVSNVLKLYYINTFDANKTKFVNYPCLSDSQKFYYDPELRLKTRKELGFQDGTIVFIYSGGISSEWHISASMFSFFNETLKHQNSSIFLILTNDQSNLGKIKLQFPNITQKLITFSAPNYEVSKYLNAADYGILFRENTIMNNVASPTKFAEYMLCGLPVIISEGVGDYSAYIVQNDIGFLLKEAELLNPERFNFNSLLNKKYARNLIAESSRRQFSKQSIVGYLIEQLMA